MRILLINTSEQTGGAAVAANRLMIALQKAGHTVHMLVRDKQSERNEVITINKSFKDDLLNKFRFISERLVICLGNKLSKKNLFQVSIANTGKDLSKNPLVKKADIIHLHWINQGLLSLKDISRLVETGKPVVWTLHDLWPGMAICHYPDECRRYQSACMNCPKQVDNPLIDLAKKTFNKKRKLNLSEITYIGCSRWITEEVSKSALLRTARFHSIPNPINMEVFKPSNKQEARQKLGLPADKPLLLFAAAKLSDERKGASYLMQACIHLKEKGISVDIVLMGNQSLELADAAPFPVHELGYITATEKKVLAYSAADFFVIPSLEDNLPNTIMESMSCGTPCVGFHTGGIPEMIDHKINGYICKYKNTYDLAAGIEWVLNNSKILNLSENCIKKVERSYDEKIVVEQYRKLYESLKSNNND